MNRPREDWQRLASYVISARITAGFRDRRALAVATGVTDRTLGKLENGQRVSPDTLAAVELAVGWKPDSARMVLAGGDPVPLEEPSADVPDDADLTPEQKEAILEIYRQAIRDGRARRLAAGREGDGRSA